VPNKKANMTRRLECIVFLVSYLYILCLFWQNIFITPYEAHVYLMLDTGLSILDIEKGCSSFIQHRISSIKYLVLYGSNVSANDIFISDSGLSGLG